MFENISVVWVIDAFLRAVEPQGSLTFHRHVMSDSQFPDWSELDTRLCSLEVRSDGMIEDDGIGMLQMDFANKYIGGGVLNHVSHPYQNLPEDGRLRGM